MPKTDTTIPWEAIDEGIRGPLRVLAENNFKTISSCQGGGWQWGHGYQRPTITFAGDENEGYRAQHHLERAGYIVFLLSRIYDGSVPDRWQIEFVSGAARGK